MVLDIGCGKRKIEPDSVGIDISPESVADKLWDLDQYPWPLDTDRFSRIHMSHVIEHLSDPLRAMAEVHRVACEGADVFITTPHFSSANSYVDPTHKYHLAMRSVGHFTCAKAAGFAGPPYMFDVAEQKLNFGGNFFLDNLARLLAWTSLPWYELHATWVLPARDIWWHLRARK